LRLADTRAVVSIASNCRWVSPSWATEAELLDGGRSQPGSAR
jgi:hypothetical protein